MGVSVQQRLLGHKQKSVTLIQHMKQTDKAMKDAYLRDVGQKLDNKDWRLFMEQVHQVTKHDASTMNIYQKRNFVQRTIAKLDVIFSAYDAKQLKQDFQIMFQDGQEKVVFAEYGGLPCEVPQPS